METSLGCWSCQCPAPVQALWHHSLLTEVQKLTRAMSVNGHDFGSHPEGCKRQELMFHRIIGSIHLSKELQEERTPSQEIQHMYSTKHVMYKRLWGILPASPILRKSISTYSLNRRHWGRKNEHQKIREGFFLHNISPKYHASKHLAKHLFSEYMTDSFLRRGYTSMKDKSIFSQNL